MCTNQKNTLDWPLNITFVDLYDQLVHEMSDKFECKLQSHGLLLRGLVGNQDNKRDVLNNT